MGRECLGSELCHPVGDFYVSGAIFLLIEWFSSILQPTFSKIGRLQIVQFENVVVSPRRTSQLPQVAAPLLDLVEADDLELVGTLLHLLPKLCPRGVVSFL